jgi:hypothetical protein
MRQAWPMGFRRQGQCHERSEALSAALEYAIERTRCSTPRILERSPPAGRWHESTTRGGESSAPVAVPGPISTPTLCA